MITVEEKNKTPFLWGASISAYQGEGAILEDGKVLSIADLSTRNEAGECQNAISSDFYHHYREDIKLLAQLHAKAFRFSLSWARIFPNQTRNEAGIAFYHKVLDELERYSITPIVTLFHYDLPYPLEQEYGGWRDRRCIEDYLAYVKVCFEEYGSRISYFLTINEPDILFLYGGHGLDLKGRKEWKKQRLIINHHFALAHASVVELCHKCLPNAKIGPVFGYVPVYANSADPKDYLAAHNLSQRQNLFFQELFLEGRYLTHLLDEYAQESDLPEITQEDLELLRNAKSDIIACNYYKSDTVKWCEENEIVSQVMNTFPAQKVPGCYEIVENPYLQRTKWGWEIDPIGIYKMLSEVYDRYHLPILITENGIACEEVANDKEPVEDSMRIAYLSSHIKQCQKAMKEGVELLGYCVWSFMDLMSTAHGMDKRYGLIYVDYDTPQRKRMPKKSYYWYQAFLLKEETKEKSYGRNSVD